MRTKSSIAELCTLGLMTALLCISAPFTLPLPGMVPLSLATLALYFCTYLLGMRRALLCCSAYMILGCVGLPVFSGFTGGISRLIGPTGGYFWGYFAIILLQGTAIKLFPRSKAAFVFGMVSGTALCYALGTAWLCFVQQIDILSGLFAGVIPFLPGDALKMAAAYLLAPVICRRLENAGVLR